MLAKSSPRAICRSCLGAEKLRRYMAPMDFRLDPKLMSLLMLQEVADWISEHCSSGAAPAFSADGLVYRIEDEQEAQAFQERWLAEFIKGN